MLYLTVRIYALCFIKPEEHQEQRGNLHSLCAFYKPTKSSNGLPGMYFYI